VPKPEIVTTADRHDLDDEARAAFRGNWPEFIFHDPVPHAHIERVEAYFPRYDILLLAGGEVVAGGWGVPLAWNARIASLPDGYDGALAPGDVSGPPAPFRSGLASRGPASLIQ
jgi:hypothetical protein